MMNRCSTAENKYKTENDLLKNLESPTREVETNAIRDANC